MHVEQSWQESLSRAIDLASIWRNDRRRGGANCCDALTIDDDSLIFPAGGVFRIKNAHVLDRQRLRGMLRQITRQRSKARLCVLSLQLIELIVRFFPAGAKLRKPRSRISEKTPIIIKPNRHRLESDAGNGKLSHMQFLSMVCESGVGKTFQPRLAGRQQLY